MAPTSVAPSLTPSLTQGIENLTTPSAPAKTRVESEPKFAGSPKIESLPHNPQSVLSITPSNGTLRVFTTLGRDFYTFQTEVMAQALRVASLGTPVLVVQFFQGGIGQGISQPRTLVQNLTWMRCDLSRRITAETILTELESQAVLALWAYVQTAIASGIYGLIVLDELNLAIELQLIPETAILQCLTARPAQLDLVLTGAKMPASLIESADQVTQRRH